MRCYVAAAILTVAVVLAPVVAGYAPALSEGAFTITNNPVGKTVVDTMQQRICTGTVVPDWEPSFPVRAIFFGKPDGTKWVNFGYNGIGPADFPVDVLGVSAQWRGFTPRPGPAFNKAERPSYAVWPDGENGLSGVTASPWGTIHLTCGGQAPQ
jgi:hypothetical protein